MSPKPDKPPAQPPLRSDRRSGKDRRRVDLRLPGEPERRRLVEPRKPEVQELDLTESQWADLQDQMVPASAAVPVKGKGSG
jgi:hypothetical protein